MRMSDWSSDVCSSDLLAAEELAAEYGLDLDNSFFYSYSDDDLELLERVGKPRPLNPNMKLKGIADERNWPVQRFASRGTPSWVDYTRTIYATGPLVGAFAAGLPIWALTRSQREAVNFSKIGRASCREQVCQYV